MGKLFSAPRQQVGIIIVIFIVRAFVGILIRSTVFIIIITNVFAIVEVFAVVGRGRFIIGGSDANIAICISSLTMSIVCEAIVAFAILISVFSFLKRRASCDARA